MGLRIACNLNIPATSTFRWSTIQGSGRATGRFVRQTSGSNSFGIVELALEPYTGASQLLIDWQVPEGAIPCEYLPGVVAGIREAAQEISPERNPLTQIKLTVLDGMYHAVDSSVLSYRMATCLAFRDALKQVEAVPVQVQLESLALRQQAVGAWNSWRVREPKSRPDLGGIDLSGDTWSDELLRANGHTPADLSQIDLEKVSLVDLDLHNTNLSGANLSGFDFTLANLEGANLSGANLSRANLTLAECYDADLSGASLVGATAPAAQFSTALLTESDLREADLRYQYLYEASLEGAALVHANLSGTNLSEAHLKGGNLSGANLSHTNLSEADLQGANLSGADLSHANLRKANLSHADLSGANLSQTNLREADLTDVQIKQALLHQTDLRGHPWLLIMHLTLQPGITWSDVLYNH